MKCWAFPEARFCFGIVERKSLRDVVVVSLENLKIHRSAAYKISRKMDPKSHFFLFQVLHMSTTTTTTTRMVETPKVEYLGSQYFKFFPVTGAVRFS